MKIPPKVLRDVIQQAVLAGDVADAVNAEARRIQATAKRDALAIGRSHFAGSLRIVRGIRPGTGAGGFRRPYARITSTITDQQMRDDNRAAKRNYTSRPQILRRAARG